MELEKELMMIDLEADSKEQVLTVLGSQLMKSGFVKDGFIDSILKREENYPTGLPTEPFGVAIPHTDADMVNDSTIAFASLKQPVQFSMMGNNDVPVNVKLVFMLALKNPDDQLEMLQKLVELFQDPDVLTKLAETKDANTVNELVGHRV